MSKTLSKPLDPRVRRTRQLLHDALDRLLETKDLEDISTQDIADAATLNRATFYDHYPDKATLLRCHVALRFQALLDARGVRFNGTCGNALMALALGMCDYLKTLAAVEKGCRRPLDPHVESAVINVVRSMILDGLRDHAPGMGLPLDMAAGAAGWAIYGAAKEWLENPRGASSEQAASAIVVFVRPILQALAGFPFLEPAPMESSSLLAD